MLSKKLILHSFMVIFITMVSPLIFFIIFLIVESVWGQRSCSASLHSRECSPRIIATAASNASGFFAYLTTKNSPMGLWSSGRALALTMLSARVRAFIKTFTGVI